VLSAAPKGFPSVGSELSLKIDHLRTPILVRCQVPLRKRLTLALKDLPITAISLKRSLCTAQTVISASLYWCQIPSDEIRRVLLLCRSLANVRITS
jgi:hypothetical protein